MSDTRQEIKASRDHARYARFVNECKEVVAGTRGYVSILEAHRESGVPRGELETAARALSLVVERTGGTRGTRAVRP